jgi:hypothetical protein
VGVRRLGVPRQMLLIKVRESPHRHSRLLTIGT